LLALRTSKSYVGAANGDHSYEWTPWRRDRITKPTGIFDTYRTIGLTIEFDLSSQCDVQYRMVYQHRLDDVFMALADPTRRAILAHLVPGDASVGELSANFPMTMPAVRKHVRILERAGLVRVRREGRVRRAHLTAAPMRQAYSWMARYRAFWEFQFDQLEAFLASDPTTARGEPRRKRGTRTSAKKHSRKRASGRDAD